LDWRLAPSCWQRWQGGGPWAHWRRAGQVDDRSPRIGRSQWRGGRRGARTRRIPAVTPRRCVPRIHRLSPHLTPTMAATTAFIGLASTPRPARGSTPGLRYLAGLQSNSQAESNHQPSRRLDVNNMAKAGNRRGGVLRGDRVARISAFDAFSSALSGRVVTGQPAGNTGANRRDGERPARHWFRQTRKNWRAPRRCRASSSGAARDRSRSPPTDGRD
jgi:hypothetical protein